MNLFMNENDLLVFKTYYNPVEADVAHVTLESEGIYSFVKKESFQTLYPSQLPWKIELLVARKDLAKASDILNVSAPEQAKLKACPSCGSTNIKMNLLSRLASFFSSIFLFGFFFPLRMNSCKDCGKEF